MGGIRLGMKPVQLGERSIGFSPSSSAPRSSSTSSSSSSSTTNGKGADASRPSADRARQEDLRARFARSDDAMRARLALPVERSERAAPRDVERSARGLARGLSSEEGSNAAAPGPSAPAAPIGGAPIDGSNPPLDDGRYLDDADETLGGSGAAPVDGSKPGSGTAPVDGSKPGSGAAPVDGSKPGSGTAPADGSKPGSGTAPVDGSKPGSGTAPNESATPAPVEGAPPSDESDGGDAAMWKELLASFQRIEAFLERLLSRFESGASSPLPPLVEGDDLGGDVDPRSNRATGA